MTVGALGERLRFYVPFVWRFAVLRRPVPPWARSARFSGAIAARRAATGDLLHAARWGRPPVLPSESPGLWYGFKRRRRC